MKKRVVLIGSGNVATHLAIGLKGEYDIVQIYSRKIANADRLARCLERCSPTDSLANIVSDADIYIICVPDDIITTIVENVPDNGALWLHTSGTTPLNVLAKHRAHCGVLYPMQSFSRELSVDWGEVYIFIEGNDRDSLKSLHQLAVSLSPHVMLCNSDNRRILHVAAVFSCNFANHLWCQASDLLEENGLSFDAMLPLIRNTVDKLRTLTPFQSQTGPAQRGDYEVLARHMAMLDGRRHDIYELLSKSIMEKAGLNFESIETSNNKK